MPITDTLKTAEDLRKVGFTEAQAATLASKFEETAHAVGEDLKSFIHAELNRRFEALEARLDARFAETNAKIEAVRAEFHSALRANTFAILTLMLAMISVAVAVIKLFPNLA